MKGGLKLCQTAMLIFFPASISDHSPMVVKLGLLFRKRKFPLNFFNFMADRDDFIPTIVSVWSTVLQGSKQFQVCKKLKLIKQQLKHLNKDLVGNVSDVV